MAETLRPGFFLSGNAWLDDDGDHVWSAHDCTDRRDIHMLEWPTWQVADRTAVRPVVTPSYQCDDCGFHAVLWLGAPETPPFVRDGKEGQ